MAQEMLTRPPRTAATNRVTLSTRINDAKEVLVAGDFTAWSARAVRMARGTTGVWTAVIDLAPGEYQYRLLVDGQWSDHAEATRRVVNPFGSNNCVLQVK